MSFGSKREWPSLTQEEKDAKKKHWKLPGNVQRTIDDIKEKELPSIETSSTPHGLFLPSIFFKELDKKPASLFWWNMFKDNVGSYRSGEEREGSETKAQKKTKSTRPRKIQADATTVTIESRLDPYMKLVNQNKFGKIALLNLGCSDDLLPQWVFQRLENASASIRFELPMDKRKLEKLTPLQYLTWYVRLPRHLRVRYTQVFKQFTSKTEPNIDYWRLYSALNILFAQCLSEENFDIISKVLFLHEEDVFPLDVFLGISAFVDRLFWTFYLQKNLEDNTSNSWEENRTAVECADMQYLERKLAGFKLSIELKTLLISLS